MEVAFTMDFTPRSLSTLALAERFAKERDCSSIGAEHIALALAADADGLAGKALAACGVTI